MDKMRAKTAGYMYHSPAWVLPHIEKAAPIIGPKRKPRLKATPIRAIPFPLVAGVDTSVTIAVDKLTFPASMHKYSSPILPTPTLRYSTNNSGKNKNSKIAGEDPEKVGDRNP